MYYYSKKSNEKIIHLVECFHTRNTDLDDIGWFESLSQAYDQGYRLCKHCNPLSKHYKKESDQVFEYCRKNGLSVWFANRYIGIESVRSEWKIALNKKNQIVLYHKNDFETDRDHLSEIKGYHFQGDVHHDSVIEYLEYIVEHDYFRMLNPVYIPKKKASPPPMKGTKRYRSTQKRMEKRERKQAVRNVLNLIDSLHVPTTPAPAMAM